jgi:hypothetical protein
MKMAPKLVAGLSLLAILAPSLSASDGNNATASNTAQTVVSADDFDWRELVPYLFAASAMPGEQGVQAVLENSKILRAYVANEVRAECKLHKGPCSTNSDGVTMDGEVNKRIAEIVEEGILRRHKKAIVDYQLTRRPFPFSEIAVVKSDNKPDAYLILALADRNYTAAQVQEKYGAPYDTDIFQWYSVYKYRVDDARYTSKAVFEIDPVDGAVVKVAISLKARNHH